MHASHDAPGVRERGHAGVVWAFDIPTNGAVRELPREGEWPEAPSSGYRWVHVDRTHADSESWFESTGSGITELTREALIAEETRPRAAILEEGVLVVLRGMNLNPGADPEDMVAIRVLIQPHRVVSIRGRRVLAAQDLREEMGGPVQARPSFISSS